LVGWCFFIWLYVPKYQNAKISKILFRYSFCMVLLWRKFTPPSGPEIAKAVEICSLLVYLLGEKANHYP